MMKSILHFEPMPESLFTNISYPRQGWGGEVKDMLMAIVVLCQRVVWCWTVYSFDDELYSQEESQWDQHRYLTFRCWNGWINPYHQFSIHEAVYGHGIVDQEQGNALDEKEQACLKGFIRGEEPLDVSWDLLDDVIDNSSGDNVPYHVSQYDIRVWNKDGNRPYTIVKSYTFPE